MYFGLSRSAEGVVGHVAALGNVEFYGGSIPDTFRAIPDRLDPLKVENPPENPKSANFSWELVPSTWATTVVVMLSS